VENAVTEPPIEGTVPIALSFTYASGALAISLIIAPEPSSRAMLNSIIPVFLISLPPYMIKTLRPIMIPWLFTNAI
jgi:hypothetical protein